MHKNTEVAEIEIDEAVGGIIGTGRIMAAKHLPIGVLRDSTDDSSVDRYVLNKWWAGRSIPASRNGVNDVLETLGTYNFRLLLTKCFGLSLSDHYWIKPYNSDITWEKVNFFDNDFSEDIGDLLIGIGEKCGDFDLMSPDITSDGDLQKRWKIINGKRCLLKSGSKPFRQQPFNEAVASRIMKRLGIYHVPYSVTWVKDLPYSMCEDFVTKDTELISAWRMMHMRRRANHENEYFHFVNICNESGIDIVPFLDRMIVLDYIIANTDRHLNNFGLLRNPDTLEWIGAAPVYDSGSSLWYNDVTSSIPFAEVICKPFKRKHSEQLKLVSSFDWFNPTKLDGIEDEILDILCDPKVADYIELKRAKLISAEVRKRIDTLTHVAERK